MHFVLSWDIKETGGNWDQANEQLKTCIQNYSWVKTLTTTFIIPVTTQDDWRKILASLTYVAEKLRQRQIEINFLMTPVMQGGRYDGMLPQNLWEEINRRVK